MELYEQTGVPILLMSDLRMLHIKGYQTGRIGYLGLLVKGATVEGYETERLSDLIDKDDDGIGFIFEVESKEVDMISEIRTVLDYINSYSVPIVNDLAKERLLSYYGVYYYDKYDSLLELESNPEANGMIIYFNENMLADIVITRSLWPERYLLFAEESGRKSIFATEEPYLGSNQTMRVKLYNKIFTFKNPMVEILDIILNKFSGNIILAGGYIFTSLYIREYDMIKLDMDLFLIECDDEMLREILEFIIAMDYFTDATIYRTRYAVTFTTTRKEQFQIILANSTSGANVIRGFDVDCACVYYDGNFVYMSKRAMHAIAKGYNTINRYTMSDAYSKRLHKYTKRGMGVNIPKYEQFVVKGPSYVDLIKEHENASDEESRFAIEKRMRDIPTKSSELSKLIFTYESGSKRFKGNRGKGSYAYAYGRTISLYDLLSQHEGIILIDDYKDLGVLESKVVIENGRILAHTGYFLDIPSRIYDFLSDFYVFEITASPLLFRRNKGSRVIFDRDLYDESEWYNTRSANIFDNTDLIEEMREAGSFSVLSQYHPLYGRVDK